MRVLLRASARYHLRHRIQLLLAVLGVTLGVAVVVAVDTATASARRAFTLSSEAVTGRATHEILGGPAGIADSVYSRLARSAPPGIALAPVLDRYVALRTADGGERRIRLLGVDPFAERPFRSFAVPAGGQLDAGLLITRRAVLLARETATQLSLRAGDTITVVTGRETRRAIVGGVLEPEDELARRALADVALADLATAQELTGAFGILDRIEVRADEAALAAVQPFLTPGLRVLPTEARAGATARLTRAFETNLTALALVALVFGMFLIYNSVSFSVLQRRSLLGLLRAQGVTSRELFALILGEAAVLGLVATALGIGTGLLLGSQLVRLVAGTINDLYFAVSVSSVEPGAFTLAKAIVLGLAATLAAAAAPAAEAVTAPARAALARASIERRATRATTRLAVAGLGIALLAAALLAIPSRSVLLGFAALFVLILAAALLTPATTTLTMNVLQPALGATMGSIGRIAARGVTTSLSRTAPAIAALAVALAVGVAVTLMIASFRSGVVAWLAQSLQADVYISAPSAGANRTDLPLDARLPADIAALPGVAGLSTYRHAQLLIDDAVIRQIAIDMHPAQRGSFRFLTAVPDVWREFAGGALLVSEPFAWRRGLAAGDSITLPTARGAVRRAIAGVFRDYASEHGVIFIDRARYDELWDDDAITAIAVYARTTAAADDVITGIRALPRAAAVSVTPNRALREGTLRVFDRTFLITGVLRVLALLVAFVGVTGALMALQLERAREVGVLRALGLTPAQVWALSLAQTALMGVAAVALAVPLGIAMSWAMVHVVNRRSFGWGFDLVLDAAPFLQALAVGIGAALLAGLYPAFRRARTLPAAVLRGE